MERFREEYLIFLNWRLCRHCLQNEWPLHSYFFHFLWRNSSKLTTKYKRFVFLWYYTSLMNVFLFRWLANKKLFCTMIISWYSRIILILLVYLISWLQLKLGTITSPQFSNFMIPTLRPGCHCLLIEKPPLARFLLPTHWGVSSVPFRVGFH